MNKKQTYLIGSIQDSKDPNESRDKVEAKLLELGFSVMNPCKLEVNQSLAGSIEEQRIKLTNLKLGGAWDKFDEVMGAIAKEDLVCVIRSDFVIVFWDVEKKHGGTIEELLLARHENIPIYTVCYGALRDINDWILLRLRQNFKVGGALFPNNKQLLDHIQETYKDFISEHRAQLEAEKKAQEEDEKKQEEELDNNTGKKKDSVNAQA